MSGMDKEYGDFYAKRNPQKVYPVEFVVRTLLGSYPRLSLDRAAFSGGKALDLGCGDGRNMPLLNDLGLAVHGVEITEAICALTRERMAALGVPVELKVGGNSSIPFADGTFDLLLACHSCYYVADGESFGDNLREIVRVLKPGGCFVFSLPKSDSYILQDAVPLGDGHFRITRDPYGLRNGTVFRSFATEDEVRAELALDFEPPSLGRCEDDFYGIEQRVWIGAAIKRAA